MGPQPMPPTPWPLPGFLPPLRAAPAPAPGAAAPPPEAFPQQLEARGGLPKWQVCGNVQQEIGELATC